MINAQSKYRQNMLIKVLKYLINPSRTVHNLIFYLRQSWRNFAKGERGVTTWKHYHSEHTVRHTLSLFFHVLHPLARHTPHVPTSVKLGVQTRRNLRATPSRALETFISICRKS